MAYQFPLGMFLAITLTFIVSGVQEDGHADVLEPLEYYRGGEIAADVVAAIPVSQDRASDLYILKSKNSYAFVPALIPIGVPLFDIDTGKLIIQVFPFVPEKYSHLPEEGLGERNVRPAYFKSVKISLPQIGYSHRYPGDKFPVLLPSRPVTLELSFKGQYLKASEQNKYDKYEQQMHELEDLIQANLTSEQLEVQFTFEREGEATEDLYKITQDDFVAGLSRLEVLYPRRANVYRGVDIFRRVSVLARDPRFIPSNEDGTRLFLISSVREILDKWFDPVNDVKVKDLYRTKDLLPKQDRTIPFIKTVSVSAFPIFGVKLAFGFGSPSIQSEAKWLEVARSNYAISPKDCQPDWTQDLSVDIGGRVSLIDPPSLVLPFIVDGERRFPLNQPHIVLFKNPKLLIDANDCKAIVRSVSFSIKTEK